MKKIGLITCSLCLITLCAFAGRAKKSTSPPPYKVYPTNHAFSSSDSLIQNGFFYALPRTVVIVDITVSKKETIKGPFSDYAESLLGLKQFIKDQATNYQIEEVQLRQKTEYDPENVFYVECFEPNMRFQIRQQLLLEGVNMPSDSDTEQTRNTKKLELNKGKNNPGYLFFTDIAIEEQLDTVIRTRIVDTAVIDEIVIKPVRVEKTLKQRAEDAVEQILKIREERFKLITGFQEVNYTAETLAFMYAELNKMESEYLRLFTGITKTSYEHHTIEVYPIKGRRITIAGFKQDQGFVRTNEPEQMIPVTISFLNDDLSERISPFISRINPEQTHGFRYRIPVNTKTAIHLGSQILYFNQLNISQFGPIMTLPVSSSFRLSTKDGSLNDCQLGK